MSFVPRWYDLPMLAWCFCGIPSALSNGLTLYDGLSDSLLQIVAWGMPYLIGRLYFGTLEDLRYFTVAMAVGGLCYVIPCLWEARMSPQLLGQIYGLGGWQRDAAGRLSPARLLRDRARVRDVDDGRVAHGLVALALRRPEADRGIPVRPDAAGPAGHDGVLPIDRGAGPVRPGRAGAVAVGPPPDPPDPGRPPARRPLLRRHPPAEPVVRPAGRGPGHGRDRLRSRRVAGIPLQVRAAARRPCPGATDLRLGRIRPRAGLLRRGEDEAGPPRRVVDRRPREQGIRRHDADLPVPRPAGGPVRPALPGAVVGRPAAWRRPRSPRGSWGCTSSTA